MSGIAGIIHFDGKPVEPGLIEKMTSAMAHRGPDGIYHWVKGSVALGQCMLRTTPESLEEHQPLTNEDESLVLVMDGRVDNWEELRRELVGRGAVLRTRADAELVLRAYEIWGGDCLAHIDGDFALVIWDVRRQEAFCARDRMGNKPFNYHWDGKTLAFASELHAILALPWVPEIVNEDVIAEFLAAEWYSRDENLCRGIMRLVAAYQMRAGASGLRLEQYWTPDLWVTLPFDTDEEYIEYYRELLTDVVQRMSRSQQLMTCEVSGGLDSSAIFAVANQLRVKGQLLAPAMDGYVLDFHDDKDANELEYSRSVGKHLGLLIHEIPPTNMPVRWYQDWVSIYRQFPGYPNGVMGLGIRTAARDRGSRALLVGVGGDEWLGGSRTYYAEELAARQWKNFFDCLKADISDFGLRTSLWWICRFGFLPLVPEFVKHKLRDLALRSRGGRFDKRAWLTSAMRRRLLAQRRRHGYRSTEACRRIGQRGQANMLRGAYSAWAREWEERLASSAAIELRRPFLDARMIQFSFITPERLRGRGLYDRMLHRRAMTGLLPELTLGRDSKASFMVTFSWQLAELERELTRRTRGHGYGWVERPMVRKVIAQVGDCSHGGWPELMLWSLFLCDAIAMKAE